MERTRLREPSLSQYKEARPVDPVSLAPSANGTPPESKHPIAEHAQTLEVSRYRVVVEVALDDRREPLAGLGHGIVHALTELLLNLSQLGSHALADRRAPHHESPQSVLPADVLEAQKVERFRSTFPSSFPVLFGKPTELNPARLIGMEFQPKPPLAIAVGTTIAGCPPHGPGRALISASGSYLG